MATILVVDDDPNSRLLVSTLLEPAGHVVLQSADGEDALRSARGRRVDLVLTDLSMPGISGAALVRALRSDPEHSSTGVVLYTGSFPHGAMRDFMAMYGIRDVIQKPIDPATFLATIESALENVGP